MESKDPGDGSQPQPAAPSSARPRAFQMIKRLLPLLIVAVLATWFFRKAPESTELVYALGARTQGLERLEVEIFALPDRQPVRRAEFHYSAASPAPAEQAQSLRLVTDQRYEVDATFVYPDRRESVSRELTFRGEQRITLVF